MTAFKKTASMSSQDELNADGHPQKKKKTSRKAVGGCHIPEVFKTFISVLNTGPKFFPPNIIDYF
jgi:hypothetical protein